MASPYQYDPSEGSITLAPWDYERFVIPVTPAGGAWSSAHDLAILAQSLLSEQDFVSMETLKAMWTPQITLPNQQSYGLGWFVDEDYQGLLKVDHAGNTTGFTSSLTLLPEAQMGMIVLVNRERANAFTQAITDYAIELALGVEHQPLETYLQAQTKLYQALPPLATSPINPTVIQPYQGNYERHLTVEITGENQVVLQTERGIFPLVMLPELGEGIYGIQARTLLAARFQTVDGVIYLEVRHPMAGEPLIMAQLAD